MNESTTDELKTWDDFLARLYAQGEFDIDFGLDRIRTALELRGDPQRHHRAILIGGTNGKGGVASAVDAILGAHGLKTGLFTSPHLMSIRERFRIDGVPAARKHLFEIGAEILESFGKPSDLEDAPQLSFFELCFLIAVEVFQRADIDVGIYEVGLGGRLDATNTLDPEVSVITSIGLDHQRFLGETLEEIVPEKTAILREGRPGIIATQTDDRIADLIRDHAPAGAALDWPDTAESPADGEFDSEGGDIYAPRFRRQNHQTAWRAARQYLEHRPGDRLTFSESTAKFALQDVVWPGRFDLREIDPADVELPEGVGIDASCRLLLDAAHNPQAIDRLLEELRAGGISVHSGVVGFMKEKAIADMVTSVRDFLSGQDRLFGANIESPRASTGSDLEAAGVTTSSPTATALARAAALAVETAEPGSRPTVLVTGSIYLIGEVFECLGLTADDLATRRRHV